MDSIRRLQKSRAPAEDRPKPPKRLKTRLFSIRRKKQPKSSSSPPPEKDPDTVADVAVNRRASWSPERRPLPVIRPDETQPDNSTATQTHSRSSSENVDPRPSTHQVIRPRTDTLLFPERPEKRTSQFPELGQINPVPSQEQPEVLVTGNLPITTYEPTYLLRKNAGYFDADEDGIVWPRDTYMGCMDLGWGILSSCFATFALHLALSYPTCLGYTPDLYCRIRYNNMRLERYGSLRSNNEKGRPRRNRACESILVKYDQTNKGGLTLLDLLQFFKQQRTEYNVRGWIVAVFEWLALYHFLRSNNGVMRSDDIRAAFNGTVFHKKAEEHCQYFQFHRKIGNRDEFGSERRPNPVKLAVAVISGIVIMIWILRNMSQNPPDWITHWWRKYNIPQGASAAERENLGYPIVGE
ncbi:Caleosin related protein-domain-containing protein [Rostrohypoxylon terebratum]|nr:Caleosin related protein-domain-containing protein [Rostrohypoxylon terebratum]